MPLHYEDSTVLLNRIADLQAKLAAAEQRAQDAQEDRDDYRISLRQAESHIKELQQRAEQAEQSQARLAGELVKTSTKLLSDLDTVRRLCLEAATAIDKYREDWCVEDTRYLVALVRRLKNE